MIVDKLQRGYESSAQRYDFEENYDFHGEHYLHIPIKASSFDPT
jgi:hypothetical protein